MAIRWTHKDAGLDRTWLNPAPATLEENNVSAQWNDFTFASHFNGNLRNDSEPVPVQVSTRLRIMTKEMAEQVQQYHQSSSFAPHYVPMSGKDTTYEAVGRHFFTWHS